MEKRKKRKRQNDDSMNPEEVYEAPRKRKKGKKQQHQSQEVSDLQAPKTLKADAHQSRDGVQGSQKVDEGQSAFQSAAEGKSSEGMAPVHAKRKKRKERGGEDAGKRQDAKQEFGENWAEGSPNQKRKKRGHRNEENDVEEERVEGKASGTKSAKAEADGEFPQRSEEGGQQSGVSKQKTGRKRPVACDGTADQRGETQMGGAGQPERTGAKAAATEKLGSGRVVQNACQLSLYDGWGAYFEARWQRFWRGPGQQRVSFLEKGIATEMQSRKGRRGQQEKRVKKESSSPTGAGGRTDSAVRAKVAQGQQAQSGEGEAGRHVTLGSSFVIRGPLPCSQQRCSGHARYAFRKERRRLVPEVCNAHKLPGMEMQKHDICEVQGCTTCADYDFPGKKTRSRTGGRCFGRPQTGPMMEWGSRGSGAGSLASDSEDDADLCDDCGSAENPELLLRCAGAGCATTVHVYCCGEEMDEMPTGAWLCGECKKGRHGGRTRDGERGGRGPNGFVIRGPPKCCGVLLGAARGFDFVPSIKNKGCSGRDSGTLAGRRLRI
ncbi:hypothetical protein KFL_003700140 [Klebsormidium nitens]|uniref:PHD-type domain-containing protein n=1 Tax=Klebsormidium nitens TaxID=105231 RepID=A0A1Y1I9P3_KLENI|nr:hypothetical protein KFL_003700140 [Klebsormidium nitens]|eukprot:GAQ87694.1 hypothetical protein KFL_003700140 [Klebsormidium nitens]